MPDAPVDKEALFDLVDEDAAFLKRLVDTFLSDCSSYMEGIRTAVEEQDAQALTREAHGLKGAVANLQAPSAQKAAHRLEVIGRSGDLEGAASALDTLEQEIDRLRSVLTDMTEQL